MNQNLSRYAFTESVKNAQSRYGSRSANARLEQSGDRFRLTDKEVAHIRSRDMFYLGTTGENGWPYIQFRGGPKGFLKVLDDQTLGMADYRGNRQYLSTGNIKATLKALLFLVDYRSRSRLKIWSEAEVLDLDPGSELLERVTDPEYPAKVERVFRFRVKAYDWNCPQHITPRYSGEELREMVGRGELDPFTVLF